MAENERRTSIKEKKWESIAKRQKNEINKGTIDVKQAYYFAR